MVWATVRVEQVIAQTAEMTVAGVRFDGLNALSESYAQSVVRTAPGGTLDTSLLEADVTRLLATGRFATADYVVEPGIDGATVTFVVMERPRITEIRFVGNRKYADKKLRKSLPVQVGDPIDIFRAREGSAAIEEMYSKVGYGQASASFDEQGFRARGELVYVVEEGPQIRIREILFEGNASLSDKELKKKIQSNTKFWIIRDGRFDEDVVASDAAAIQTHYRNQGYLDARVSYRLAFAENQQDLTLVFVIAEGTRYVVEAVIIRGNTAYEEAPLRSRVTANKGDFALQRRIEESAKALENFYGSNGYIDARVRTATVFSATPGLVQLQFDITEGRSFRVGRIVVRGNERTQDKVVRRAIDLFPTDVFDTTRLEFSKQRLQATQLFNRVDVVPVGDEPETRDVLVNIEESRKAGDFLFGFGVTSNSGLLGSIVLDLKNFDLLDTPRSFEEWIKFRSFHGAGQRLRVEAQPGAELNRFRVDFTEPYLMDQPVRFDLSAYYFDREREASTERRVGANVSFGKRLEWRWLRDWYGEISFRIENVKTYDLDVGAPRDVRKVRGNTLLTSVKGSLTRDRTDSRFMPTKGDRLQLGYQQFGNLIGDDAFGKLTATYAWYRTLYRDELERPGVLMLRATGGFILGDAPFFDRFYAGGIGSIRGFEFRGVSPRQGISDVQVGGDFLALLTTEYSFPLYGQMLRGLVFADMGTVESEFEITRWRTALGAGVRLQVDFFGPVPLEFDVAIPVSEDDEDEDQIFSFYVGATF